MNRKAGNKRPRPSYTEGKLRSKGLAEKQDPKFKRAELSALIKKAATKEQGRPS